MRLGWYSNLDPVERRIYWACFAGFGLDSKDTTRRRERVRADGGAGMSVVITNPPRVSRDIAERAYRPADAD